MIPYINFVNYSKDYNWFIELIRPQPSLFTETINRNIYKTWNGEALINFKWNTYGKYYYAMIWILFMTLLGCFTAAATIPNQYINEEVRQRLFIASIILGSIHLIFEIRQFFYNITNKWFYNFWNIFDIIAYVLSIFTSIYWLQTKDKDNNYLIQLLSFSCLFLDIKFLFFRAFEYFVLFIIIISFAHAFYILLSLRSEFSLDQHNTNNDDPNNPLNLAPSYSQINNDGIPDKNTNMFIDIKTSLFAIYFNSLSIGDSSALSNWPYADNPSIAILIILFCLLIIVSLIFDTEGRAEIELFYLLPHQRRWKTWFPKVMYYYADVDKTRIEIKRLIKEGEWDTKEFTEMRENLFKVLSIEHNPIDNEVILEKLSELRKIRKILS
ncbi:hypothetical protein GLOIN_2v936047 [Rhizophagus irregularis DAOM 181602=DAOM 197198]|nr:hypothetical protein GLOIN_2v936047 [Rhizophagus irregularis DAOM 181602=DAOM 197198]